MIDVKKKELVERKFTPYQITITVNNEEDHNNLQKEFEELRSIDRWYNLNRSKYRTAISLVNTILSHQK